VSASSSWEVAERDHDIQNPTGFVACGKGGPAIVLASAYGCRRRALEEWLALHANAREIRGQHERHRRDYLAFRRALLGWAIFVGRRG
jgi:hypothetical protein